jgi:hypothetical protein
MYEPIARRLIEHAEQTGEPEAVIARARRTLKQPGDSARHDDHLHVRVYCSAADRAYGCVDIGPMELLAEREAEPPPVAALMTALAASPPPAADAPAGAGGGGPAGAASALGAAAAGFAIGDAAGGGGAGGPERLGRLLRTRIDRLALRGWR